MFEWFKMWVSSIIIAVILSIIIELLNPEGKNKKYVKVVSGIYILYTIIKPFLGYNSLSIENIVIENNIIQTNSESVVAETYLRSLEEYIKSKIQELNYEVKEVNIFSDNYTDIIEIEIKMKNLSYDEEMIKNIILNEIELDSEKIIIK